MDVSARGSAVSACRASPPVGGGVMTGGGEGWGHAPTPYALTVAGDVGGGAVAGWRLCLDTGDEATAWLAALTDAVMGASAREFNDGLQRWEEEAAERVEAGKNRAGGGGGEGEEVGKGQWQFQLWQLQQYYCPPPPDGSDRWRVGGYRLRLSSSSSNSLTGGTENQGGVNGSEGDRENKVALLADNGDGNGVEGTKDLKGTSTPSSYLSPPPVALRGYNLAASALVANAIVLLLSFVATASLFSWGLKAMAALAAVNLTAYLGLELEGGTEGSGGELWTTTPKRAEGGGERKGQKDGSGPAMAGKRGIAQMGAVTNAGGISDGEGDDAVAFMPRAGSTTVRVKNPDDQTGAAKDDSQTYAAYRSIPGSVFQVRSYGYLTNGKKKVPSQGELYSLAAMDVFESGIRFPDMAKRVRLPGLAKREAVPENGEGLHDGDGGSDGYKTKPWSAPDVFVVSLSLPTEAPKLGRPTDDGPGFTVTMYYTMKEQTRNVLQRIADDPAYDGDSDEQERDLLNGVRLFDEWCRRSPSEPSYQARFKFIPNGDNLKEIGVPSWICKYSGKPVLIKRAGVTGFLHDHRPDLGAMEFDISIHPFPYLVKQATAYMKENYFRQLLASFAFVIEGRDDSELPEVLIGEGAQLCYPDPDKTMKGEDWFVGRRHAPLAGGKGPDGSMVKSSEEGRGVLADDKGGDNSRLDEVVGERTEEAEEVGRTDQETGGREGGKSNGPAL